MQYIRKKNKTEELILCEVKRGADRAEIFSLSFSSTAEWLAVSSDEGTIHVFNLTDIDNPDHNTVVSPTSSLRSLIKDGTNVCLFDKFRAVSIRYRLLELLCDLQLCGLCLMWIKMGIVDCGFWCAYDTIDAWVWWLEYGCIRGAAGWMEIWHFSWP